MHSPISYKRSLSLTTCDQTPVRFPGALQDFAALAVVTVADGRVSALSRNLLPEGVKQRTFAKTMTLADVLGPDLARLAWDAARRGEALSMPLVPALAGGWTWLTCVTRETRLLVSLERGFGRDATTTSPLPRHDMAWGSDLEAAFRATLRLIDETVQADRLFIYRFDDLWNGEVVAEVNHTRMPSMLHHWFPTSDIPKPARDQYLLDPFRLIANVHGPTAEIMGVDGTAGDNLDLIGIAGRGVSPIHLEYLNNMGVESSFSLAILVQGRLWGLVACQCLTPKYINPYVRQELIRLGKGLGDFITEVTERESRERGVSRRTVWASLRKTLRHGKADGFIERDTLDQLRALQQAAAIAVITQGKTVYWRPEGRVVGHGDLATLVAATQVDGQFTTSCLSELDPEFLIDSIDMSGALAVAVPGLSDAWVCWLRPSKTMEFLWGGNPHAKPPTYQHFPGRIHPRRSFETWREQVSVMSQPWTPDDVVLAREVAATCAEDGVFAALVKACEDMAT